ncbi:GATA zinc finger domain-containing protein 14-like isoform X2 [Aphidius gifuensis]|uniref:GATA zinc finger domain-containing protein 14-like isoform X2 n=1 Tax=Aphidius gifuensis TaxID=684658 RepID=UPI001CDBFC25|nr:GATA zinc finger domain-containing protein 14-like isoform X2 [Aphidius gifuensis]
MDKIELLGDACFSHGPYTFYKAVRISNGRVLRLGNFFLTKLWTDADLVSIGELQLLWLDSRGSNQPLASLRLYFLPENTPDGRRDTHGEDEVLTISEKIVVRVHDLVSWLSPDLEWSCGREVAYPPSSITGTSPSDSNTQKFNGTLPKILTDPCIDFTDVDKQQKEYKSNINNTTIDTNNDVNNTNNNVNQADDNDNDNNDNNDINNLQKKVIVLSYSRYCRYRAMLRRLEGREPAWLCSSVAAALGGFTALPGTRILFCRDTFDYPDLETHELLCNHLAPKLKGRPRRKRKKRSVSPGESSNESEASVASTSVCSTSNSTYGKPCKTTIIGGINRKTERKITGESSNESETSVASTSVCSTLNSSYRKPRKTKTSKIVRQTETEEPDIDEINFIENVTGFMNERGTPLGKMPLLGYKKINLWLFYLRVRGWGGYNRVCAFKQWKTVYKDIGGNITSTSAATVTRRHYERLLLPYERYLNELSDDDDDDDDDNNGNATKLDENSIDIKDKQSSELTDDTLSKEDIINDEKLKTDENGQNEPPSPPPSSNNSTSSTTPSTTPTGQCQESALEKQLNNPLINQYNNNSVSIATVTNTNTTTVVTLTPPPDNEDVKQLKNDVITLPLPATTSSIIIPTAAVTTTTTTSSLTTPTTTTTTTIKQTNILAQGKENIPVYTNDKLTLPELIDLEPELPSPKRSKLDILRNGGLEVTAVDVDIRPSVIQATITPVNVTIPSKNDNDNDKLNTTTTTIKEPTLPTTSICDTKLNNNSNNNVPKLISVTVTPDIGHILPTKYDQQSRNIKINQNNNSSNNNSNNSNNNSCSSSPRIINLGVSSNSNLLNLYGNTSNATTTTTTTTTTAITTTSPLPSSAPRYNQQNDRILPLKVTQSRSIFSHNERTIYGNPKDILNQPKYQAHHHHQQQQLQSQPQQLKPQVNNNSNNNNSNVDILDLTSRIGEPSKKYSRPNLEIVRVPVVQRPNILNLDIKKYNNSNNNNIDNNDGKLYDNKNYCYKNMLDNNNRTITTNNLEITLVNPKQQRHQVQIPSHNTRNITTNGVHNSVNNNNNNSNNNINNHNSNLNNSVSNNNNNSSIQQGRYSRQTSDNNKYLIRQADKMSSYLSRKASQVIVPNVPNLNHLQLQQQQQQQHHQHQQQQHHHQQHQQQQQQHHHHQQQQHHHQHQPSPHHSSYQSPRLHSQQLPVGKRKSNDVSRDNHHHHHNNHHNHHQKRIEHQARQQQQQQQQQHQQQQDSRRHSMPNIQSGYSSTNNIQQSGNNNNNNNQNYLPQLQNSGNKYLPQMIDPVYYSALYSGFLPPLPQGPTPPYLSPEFSAYYKDLIASQPRMSMPSHQPTVPTSK